MQKDYPGEQWKKVKFNFDFTNDFVMEVSNFGRLRTFNKISNGNIIKGSMINGYRIVRLKFFTAREEKLQKHLARLQKEVFAETRKIKALKNEKENKKVIVESENDLIALKKKLHKKYMQDVKKRTIHYHALIHRLVATYFLPKPKAPQILVAHLDYNKLNNKADNLKWMTPEENYAHQQKSPYVIEEKKERKFRRKENSRATKLTVTKVMLLKKMLNENKPIKRLVKQFKVTDTQILRIKRGENWGEIEAAK